MKNVPHQINQIPRLTEGLRVFQALIEGGNNVESDSVVGDALARGGVYTFRGDGRDVESRLAEEHTKPRASRGTETCARDLRRLFELLGFLRPGDSLSDDARRLIELRNDPLNLESRAIWSSALDRMTLTDSSGTSHPYRTLLRLVRERPGISVAYLGLCLEARDDTENEFQRVRSLAGQADVAEMWRSIGVSKHMARNSIKIIPKLAVQLGDILEAEDGYHLGQPDTSAAENEPVEATAARARVRQRRFDRSRPREARPSDGGEEARRSVRIYDPDLVGERLTLHEACLRRFSDLVPLSHEQYEGDYDLLVLMDANALLVEVKTIRDDEVKQLRLALGQVLYYEHMLVEPMYPDHEIYRVAITDSQPHDDLIRLLERHRVGVAWLPTGGPSGLSTVARQAFDACRIPFP